MRQRYSWAEPFLGSVHLVLVSKSAEGKALLALSKSAPESTEFKEGMVEYAWQHHRTTLLHEWGHILQVASCPLLFVRARRSARYYAGPFRYLRQNPGPHELPITFTQQESWHWGQQIEALPVKVTFEGGHVRLKHALAGRKRRGVLCELDLIEEDATIFQYRSEIGRPGNGKSYSAWLSEGVRYRKVFDLTSRLIGQEWAFRFIPTATQAAFSTTRPVEAFFYLLGAVYKTDATFVLDLEDTEILFSIFKDRLLEYFGELDPESLSPMISSSEDQPGVITDEQFRQVIQDSPQLAVQPMASEHAPPLSGSIGELLREPWKAFPRNVPFPEDSDGGTMPTELLPPAISIRMADASYTFGSTILWISPSLIGRPVPGVDADYDQLVLQGLRFRHLSKALTSLAPGPNKECPHKGCPINDTGLCRDWFPIPERWEDCSFPGFFLQVSGHEVAVQEGGGKFLAPVGNKE